MKRSNRFFIAAFASCLMSIFFYANNSFAQPPQGRGFPDSTRTAATVDSLAKKLSLSKEQNENTFKKSNRVWSKICVLFK